MKISRLLSIYFITILIISCGPTGATRKERLFAEKKARAGDEILKKQNLSISDLNTAYKLFEESAEGYHDDERELANVKTKQGRIRFMQGKNSDALNILRDALKLNPDLTDPYLIIVKIYYNQKRPNEAMYWANEGIKRNAYRGYLYHYLGLIRYEAQRFTDAEDSFQQALKYRDESDSEITKNSRVMIERIRELLRSGATEISGDLVNFAKKTILTFNDVAQIINLMIPIRKIANERNSNISLSSDNYTMLNSIGIYNKNEFLRDKYVSRGDFAYILFRIISYFRNKEENIQDQYKENPGIPDLEKSYYAFTHVLYSIESNLLSLLNDGRFGVMSNLSGEVCISGLKIVKERFVR